MDKLPEKQNWDYIQNPLDLKKCNAEYIECSKDSFVVVKATKKIKANTEILISNGKKCLMSKCRSDWAPSNTLKNSYSPFIRNVISAYDINVGEASTAFKNHTIQVVIMNFF